MNLEVRCSSRISWRAPRCPGVWGGGSARRSQPCAVAPRPGVAGEGAHTPDALDNGRPPSHGPRSVPCGDRNWRWPPPGGEPSPRRRTLLSHSTWVTLRES